MFWPGKEEEEALMLSATHNRYERQRNTRAYTITISNKTNSQKVRLLLLVGIICETGGEAKEIKESTNERRNERKKNVYTHRTDRECCYVLFNKCYMLLI